MLIEGLGLAFVPGKFKFADFSGFPVDRLSPTFDLLPLLCQLLSELLVSEGGRGWCIGVLNEQRAGWHFRRHFPDFTCADGEAFAF